MKKIILIYITFLLTVVFSACNLDYAPENTMVDEIVYKNEKTAQAALLGAYVRLNVFVAGAPNDQNYYSNTGYTFLFADIGTPNIKLRDQLAPSYVAMQNAEYTSEQHDNLIYNTWKQGYNAIDYANNIIQGIEEFGKYDAAVMKQHIAEAKFIRAYAYMTLLQLFGDGALTGNSNGLGVVMRLKPYDGYKPADIQPRVTIAESYAQIISDLNDAIADLPPNVLPSSVRIRATQPVAKAFLSRVYLYRGTYSNVAADLNQAAQLALEVLNTTGYGFSNNSDDFRNQLFPANINDGSTEPNPTVYSNELIFVQPSRISTNKFPNGLGSYFQKRTFFAHPDFVSSFPAGDLRGYIAGSKQCLIQQGDPTNYSTDFTSIKYDNVGGYNDVIYIRLAEMKLTYAEAIVRVNNQITTAALQQLNDVRSRAFLPANRPAAFTISDFSSTDAFINEVLTQRNRELAFEGHYRWDLIRSHRPLLNTQIPDNKKMLPVPDYEVRISNGVIQQNMGFR